MTQFLNWSAHSTVNPANSLPVTILRGILPTSAGICISSTNSWIIFKSLILFVIIIPGSLLIHNFVRCFADHKNKLLCIGSIIDICVGSKYGS